MEALLVFKDHGRYYWPGFNGTYQDQWYLHNMFDIRTTQYFILIRGAVPLKDVEAKLIMAQQPMRANKNLPKTSRGH